MNAAGGATWLYKYVILLGMQDKGESDGEMAFFSTKSSGEMIHSLRS